MKYFKTAAGKILCTFIRPGNSRHEIMLRCDPIPDFPEYDPGFTSYPSPEYPEEWRHGKMVEISEQEAVQADPDLFESWTGYEELKRLEPEQAPAPAKKRGAVQKRALVQETLF